MTSRSCIWSIRDSKEILVQNKFIFIKYIWGNFESCRQKMGYALWGLARWRGPCDELYGKWKNAIQKKKYFFSIFDHVTKRSSLFFEKFTFYHNIVFQVLKVLKVMRKKRGLWPNIISVYAWASKISNNPFFCTFLVLLHKTLPIYWSRG